MPHPWFLQRFLLDLESEGISDWLNHFVCLIRICFTVKFEHSCESDVECHEAWLVNSDPARCNDDVYQRYCGCPQYLEPMYHNERGTNFVAITLILQI